MARARLPQKMVQELIDEGFIGKLHSVSVTVYRSALSDPSRKTPEWLTDASRAMTAALENDDLDAWARADESFHRQLLQLAGNTVVGVNFVRTNLLRTIEDIGTLVNGRVIDRQTLRDNDVIVVGITELVYHEPRG